MTDATPKPCEHPVHHLQFEASNGLHFCEGCNSFVIVVTLDEQAAIYNAHDRLQAEHEAVTNLLRILEPLVFLKDRQGRVVTAIRNIKEARGEA